MYSCFPKWTNMIPSNIPVIFLIVQRNYCAFGGLTSTLSSRWGMVNFAIILREIERSTDTSIETGSNCGRLEFAYKQNGDIGLTR